MLMPRVMAGRNALVSLQRPEQHTGSHVNSPSTLGHRAAMGGLKFRDASDRTHS